MKPTFDSKNNGDKKKTRTFFLWKMGKSVWKLIYIYLILFMRKRKKKKGN